MALAAALLLLLLAGPAAYAEQYTVGDSGGWSSTGDYEAWVQGKTFRQGDTLLFNYGGSHSVDEVRKSDYENCNSGNALKTHSGGSNVITLSSTGAMYFICPTAGHCSEGMKLAVTVVAASGSSPSTPGGSTSSPPPPPPSGAPRVFSNTGLMLGFSLVLGAVLAIVS